MTRPVSYNQLPFYLKKLNALLAVQPQVYAAELFPANWKAIQKRDMIRQLKETEEFYILEMKAVRFFKDFSAYAEAKDQIELTVSFGARFDCLTLQRPTGPKISIWPAEISMVLKELHAFQDSLLKAPLED